MERRDFHDFQSDFKELILSGEPRQRLVSGLVAAGDTPAANRLNIHRNNYRESLSGNLANHFPALEAFVGEEFIGGALKEFCTANPPVSASLASYGAGFAEFMDNHAVSEQLPYISDIIRLEWAMHDLQTVPETIYEEKPREISGCAISDNVRLIDSKFPLMSIWSSAMGHIPAESIHLEQGGQLVVALLHDAEISLMALDDGEAIFLRSIMQSNDASQEDESFKADAAQKLFGKRILVTV